MHLLFRQPQRFTTCVCVCSTKLKIEKHIQFLYGILLKYRNGPGRSAATTRRMRTQGATRGDGSPAGVHVPAADRRHPVAQASAHGLHIRRGYGSLLTLHAITLYTFFALQLDEINQLFLPNMKNKLLWFYQEVDEPEPPPVVDANKPGPSRTGMASSSSKTPQGKGLLILILS